MKAANAGWPLPSLLAALARSGWSVLAGRRGGAMRSVLRALGDILPGTAAAGLVTAPQIADAAGISERWARLCLTRLEAAGVIRWTRGGIQAGQPTPSLIRVDKRAIAALVEHARRARDKVLSDRAVATAARLARTLRPRATTIKRPGQRRNRRVHAELSASLPSSRRGGREGGAPGPAPSPPPATTVGQPRTSNGPRWQELQRRIAAKADDEPPTKRRASIIGQPRPTNGPRWQELQRRKAAIQAGATA